MGHTAQVDRLLIRTAAGQAGIGNNDGQITGSAPTLTVGQIREGVTPLSPTPTLADHGDRLR